MPSLKPLISPSKFNTGTSNCIKATNSPDQPRSTPPPKLQRALGVDYGRKFIGIAVSTLGLSPRPLPPLRGGGFDAIMQMAYDVVNTAVAERCDGIVIGLPVTSKGSIRRRNTDSQQGRRCRNFGDAVAAAAATNNLTVYLVDEAGTTMEAEALLSMSGGKRSEIQKKKDSVAAALILTAYFNEPEGAVRVKVPDLIQRREDKNEIRDEET